MKLEKIHKEITRSLLAKLVRSRKNREKILIDSDHSSIQKAAAKREKRYARNLVLNKEI